MPALSQPQKPDFATARFNMVESQVRPNKVRDVRLLEALGRVPREVFVPTALTGIAYIDEDIQVGPGRFLLEPMVLGRLLQEAVVKETDRVLDLAPASGYSTAVLAGLAKNVVAVESDETLGDKAVANLAALGIGNAAVQKGPLVQGWKADAPYNVILVNGSVEVVPEALMQQLAEGGRLLITMREFGPGRAAHQGEARLYEKIHGNVSYRALFDANVKLLPGFEEKRGFTF